MIDRASHPDATLFDFGPLAGVYDRWYDTPAGRTHDEAQKRDVRRLLPPTPSHETLLDVGCGTGHWSSFFAGMGYQVTGIDIAPQMIDLARAAVPECSFMVGDVYGMRFRDASFDVVAAMATLEFLPNSELAIQEMIRCARPGGSLLIGTLNRLAPLNQHRLLKGRQPYASADLFSPKELRALLCPRGRVRMVASSPRERKRRLTITKRIGRRLRGPFVVAEVDV